MKSFCKPKNVDVTDEVLIARAVYNCYDTEKLKRKDFRRLLVETGTITHGQIDSDLAVEYRGRINATLDALVRKLSEEIKTKNGSIEFKPVRQFDKIDGISGKLRHLCQESPKQQVYEYIVKEALQELFDAKLLPCQYGSLPGGGQVRCKKDIERHLRRKHQGVVDVIQGDGHKAYPSTHVVDAMKIIRKYCHKNKPLCILCKNVMANYPGGVLIIGGYFSSWIFNLVMSFFLRRLLNAHKFRRGKRIKLVEGVVSYADDFILFGKKSNLIKALKRESKWLFDTFGIKVKDAWKVQRFHGFSRRNKYQPAIDMAGYQIRPTYTRIRKAIFKRLRRQLIRAGRDIATLGFIPYWRARRITSYNGWITHSDSRNLNGKYNYKKILRYAKSSLKTRKGAEKIMKTEYPFSPEEIEIFDIGNQTDIILRKNIAKEAIKRGEDERESTVYICEEVQTRKKGTITKQEAMENFEVIWNEASKQEEDQPTLEQRVSALEAAQIAMIDMEVK